MPCDHDNRLQEVAQEADRLNHIIGNLRESKNSRNAAITLLRQLERETGMDLRWAA